MSWKKIVQLNTAILSGVTFLALPTIGTAQTHDGKWDGELSQEDYEELSGCEKQDYLWDTRILPSVYGEGGGTRPSFDAAGGWQALLGAPGALFSLDRSFDHISDEMPRGRRKFIHPFGSVALIEFQALPDSPYTGILSADSACGLARLSLAGPPSFIGYTPGMALKFFVDGKPSVNLQVMNSLNGQGRNQNFFENPFSNSIEEPTGFVLRTLAWWFGLFVDNPFYLGLDHVASTTPEGDTLEDSVVPYELVFVAADGISIPPDTDRDLRDELADLEPGTILYEVYARDSEEAGADILIGHIVTLSHFEASEWGDQKLFFRHHE
jgi:hypothetical protein